MPYIGRSERFGVRTVFHYLASNGDTSVSGNDTDGKPLSFTDGNYIDVYLNGVRLKLGEDYNTDTANTIAGLTAMNANDEVNVVAYDAFSIADTVPASGGTFGGNVTFQTDVSVGDDLSLASDSAVLNFGTDSEINLTHVADTGLLLNSTSQLQFGDSGTHISQSADGVLDLVADTELELNATTIDVNGKIDLAGGSLEGGVVINEDSADVDFRVESNGNANMLFVDGGDDGVVIGHNAKRKTLFNTTATAALQIEGTSGNTAAMSIARNSNDDNGPQLVLAKSNGTAGAAVTVVTDDALLGRISWQGADGTQTVEGARIEAFVDGTPGADDMPSRIVFSTTADDAATVTERMKILSGGQVIIGTSTGTSNQLFVKSTVAATTTIQAESENQTSGHTGYFYSNSSQTGNTMRIYQDGAGSTGNALYVHTDGNITPVFINRQSQDGALVDLRQGGTQEGTISVSGSTVSYNAFSGSHWSRLSDNSKPDLLRGTVIETIDAMCVWYHLEYTIPQVNYTKDDEDIPSDKKIGDERYGSQPLVVSYDKPDNVNVGDKINYDHNGTTYEATVTKNGDVKHVQCKVSDTADSTRVYGVFLSWDNDDDSVNDMYVTAVGTNLLRVHKDQTISAGDLLVSNGDGTAKKQDDDIVRSKTIGKALTNIKSGTYDDGSYTLPCALYCG